jgi:hypothetical protein
MLYIQPIRHQSDIGNIENDAVKALENSNAGTLSPELAAFLQYVEEHGDEVSQELAAGIDQLQELFLGAVHQAFQLAGVTVDSRVSISLNRHGKLQIETVGAEQEQIEELLSSSGVLPELLELACVQNALLDAIGNLRLAAEVQNGGNAEKLSELRQAYRVCLKGQLSHFYHM